MELEQLVSVCRTMQSQFAAWKHLEEMLAIVLEARDRVLLHEKALAAINEQIVSAKAALEQVGHDQSAQASAHLGRLQEQERQSAKTCEKLVADAEQVVLAAEAKVEDLEQRLGLLQTELEAKTAKLEQITKQIDNAEERLRYAQRVFAELKGKLA